MRGNRPVELYAILYLPWLLSILLDFSPVLSYLTAWLGSFFIFYVTLSGNLRQLPQDREIADQLMRPIFLVHIIFAGYMCSTSIFYFMEVLGYTNFNAPGAFYLVDEQKLQLTAQCQRYYCLGHAAFVTGILAFMKYPIKQKYYVGKEKIANLLFVVAIVTLPLSTVFLMIKGLAQFYYQFSSLSFIAGTLALAFAIPMRKTMNTFVCVLLYGFNFSQALISGFKEPIIISVLVLGIFLYPNYKRVVVITVVPTLLALFLLLPTYNRVFRANSWAGETTDDQAAQLALQAALNSDDKEGDSNWGFYAYRFSEIDMFTNFVQSTPEKVPFYGTKLLEQSAIVLVPRVFWPSKPVTEQMVMERVYDANVINRGSNVSAKPAYIVDAYLCYGGWGVFLFLFLYGVVCQVISHQAEQLFGGYVLGTALVFSGMFQILWRGLSFEFLINSVFWSYVSMLVLFRIFRALNILKPV
ncbi:exosortase Y-associated Wzy-like protein [Mucilaginibacter auburnensis]|uniref:Oligosaccharide repeat unit polymerase n=1 Tax=Mucilaginibacter auburnensis TaxID=1457233 RepID=A0A2H9VMD3_9SPHI|nr:hypothetical protein [Mucilaginibacter auburnensis]PJJ79463.1 hypothetical protein CLV57_2597 [Mucilaginibacter auburnensis]